MAEIELAAAIVVHKGRVLIVQRSETEKLAPGVWGVPCGKIEKGEKPEQAVLRELHEETGLNGWIVRFAGDREFPSTWRGRPITNLQWNYLIEPEVDSANTDDMPKVNAPNHQKSKWIRADTIDNEVGLDKHNRETIRQGLKALAVAKG